jgi:hypothetical protein
MDFLNNLFRHLCSIYFKPAWQVSPTFPVLDAIAMYEHITGQCQSDESKIPQKTSPFQRGAEGNVLLPCSGRNHEDDPILLIPGRAGRFFSGV